ncbi:T7SS effector LXG polymorphic toxin [Bacillus marasmi]|uniref:T7SS effector LXG polymorphic toxin n=1 Tax=Bacillus marasmi TaxID=1926279 RepID=UPI0011CBCB61|nr:T7SS effector LXG polymorphic toxin [Bacillus marasmi]
MGNKVDISEVITFSDNVGDVVKDLQSAFKTIESNIQVIDQMDSFSGKAAKSAKKYFKDFHSTINKAFDELFTSIDKQLSSHIAIFKSDVDSSESALIDCDYLNDHIKNITNLFNKMIDTTGEINETISRISDISSISPPSTSIISHNKSEATDYINKTGEKLTNFTLVGKDDHSKINNVLNEITSLFKHVGELKGDDRFTTFYASPGIGALLTIKKINEHYGKAKTAYEGFITSKAMYKAGKNAGLRTEVVIVNGKKYYRLHATEEALKHLGIEPDAEAQRAFNRAKKLASGSESTTMLKYASKKPGKSGWSKTGEAALKKHSSLEYLNDKAGLTQKAKTVGKASLKGAGNSIKEVFDVKGIAKSGSFLKGAGKALAPIGAGLSGYSNFAEAKAEGVSGGKLVARTAMDTTVDLAVSGAVQTGIVAAFTVAIPIPGVGTAIGVGVGLWVNYRLSKRGKDKFGKEKNDSVMDKLKSWYH